MEASSWSAKQIGLKASADLLLLTSVHVSSEISIVRIFFIVRMSDVFGRDFSIPDFMLVNFAEISAAPQARDVITVVSVSSDNTGMRLNNKHDVAIIIDIGI
jgi:hypothetical protein